MSKETMSSLSKANEESKVSPYRWLVWGVLVVVYLTVFFHRLSTGVIVGNLTKDLGMSATQIANLSSCYFYSYAIMQIPTGILVDYLGPKKTVILGSVVAALGSIMFSFSNVVMMAYFSRLLVGLGVSVVFLSILKIQANWFPANKFATMNGATSFIGSMGGILAQAPLIALIGVVGWRGSFRIMGVVSIVLAILVIIFIKNSPKEMGLPEVNPIPAKAEGKQLGIMAQLVEILKNPRIWGPAIAFGGVNGGFLLYTGTFGVPFLMAQYGMTKTTAANIISFALIASGIGCLFIGKISDMLKNRKIPMIVMTVVSTLVWVTFVFMKAPVGLVVVASCLVGLSGSVGVVCWAVGKEVCNPRVSGMSTSVVNVCGFVFAAIIPVVCGRFVDANMATGMGAGAAYQKAFIIPLISSVLALVFAILSKETKGESIYKEK
ncbi:MAG: MFS transporter [Lachnospiraceae bacterium]|nr:MFS transporter [Lachnospiraceae bacterium]